ncbi:hypothetical protein [uncultured Kordia sp.]|uniref:tetratricopeptide repeat protein n=1 Tax=uncultured Kordia sp. TaxID=507699 RepID=UPI00261B1682|nr:hypothetical protein [uncultured Kordia sp.]
MSTRISSVFFLMIFNLMNAQTYELKSKLTTDDKKEIKGLILKQYNNRLFTFALTTNDLKSSISDFQENIFNRDNFLHELKEKFKDDTLNVYYLHQKGEYYENKKDLQEAKNYYELSLKGLNKNEFKNDSAKFYSFRAVLHHKLGKEKDVRADFEKALKINPLDSIAILTYPMGLFMEGNPKKAKDIYKNFIEKTDKNFFNAYFFYSFFDLISQMEKVMEETNSEEKHKNYNQTFDLSSIDEYAQKLKNKEAKISEAQNFFHFLAIMMNYLTSIDHSNFKGVLPKVDAERAKKFKNWLTPLYKEKQLNTYTYHRFLGIIHLLMEEDEKAIMHLKKIVDIIPKEKQTPMMDINEPYTLLAFIYKRNKTYDKYREVIKMKIEKRKNEINIAEAYNNIGMSFLLENDDWKSAKEWVKKALSLEYNNFKSLGLLSYINLLNGREIMKSHYIETAGKYVNDETKLQIMVYQICAYHLLKEELKNARIAIDSCNKTYAPSCEAAQELFNKYVTTTH